MSRDATHSVAPQRRGLQLAGILTGTAFFLLTLATPPPGMLEAEAWRVAGVGLLMASLWVSEALPLPATALLPIVLFPLLGISDIGEACAPYADRFIFLFLGGFVLALAMERCGLHRRIALRIVRLLGTGERAMVAGFMLASALLSMWVSNTATALMMLPIAVSVLRFKDAEADPAPTGDSDSARGGGRLPLDPTAARFGPALLIGIAFGCSIGGMATLVGTPPNALLAGYLARAHGIEIGFGQWMLVGVPLALVGLPCVHLILTRLVFPLPATQTAAGDSRDGGNTRRNPSLPDSGPVTPAERRVSVVFAATALAWIFRPVLSSVLPGLSDTGIAVGAAVALFLIPSGGGRGNRLMDWSTAESLPWGVLVLFGGGLSLASAVQSTGLAEGIGQACGGLGFLPLPLLVGLLGLGILLLTELTSNTATAAAFLPVVGAVAVGIGHDPVLLAVPAALAASGAFMLPVATPPNAVIFASGRISMSDLMRAGIWANLLFVLLIPTLVLALTHVFLVPR